MARSVLFLFCGVLACSSAAVMLKASNLRPEVISAVRLLLAALILLPLFRRERRIYGASSFTPQHSRRTWLPAVALSGHFIFWAYGAHNTITAQASLIVNLVPVALPFFLYAMAREHINRGEIIATVMALSGLALLSGREAFSSQGALFGNLACFVAMLFLAWYMALGRSNRDFASVWLYVVPVYFRAGLICLVLSLPTILSLLEASAKEWLLLLALALIPTILGHTLLNLSMRKLRGQLVSLANTGQFIFAGIMAWLFFHELPPPVFYLSAVIVLTGVFLAIRFTPPAPPKS